MIGLLVPAWQGSDCSVGHCMHWQASEYLLNEAQVCRQSAERPICTLNSCHLLPRSAGSFPVAQNDVQVSWNRFSPEAALLGAP